MSCLSMWFVIAFSVAMAHGAEQKKASLRSTSHRQLMKRNQFQLTAATSGDIKEIHEGGFVRVLEFKHQLRVCNAFPAGSALHISRSNETRLTGDAPLPYKACRDFQSSLKAGDRLEFNVGEESSGTFSVSELPSTDAVLLLVLRRHDTASMTLAFESHVFASAANAQVAIIDTYRYKANAHAASQTKSILRIMDVVQGNLVHATQKHASAARSEELRYNSVVAVNQGIYEVELDSPDGKAEDKNQLVALNHESYVVLRTGVEAEHGPSYPEELVIYPSSNPGQLLQNGVSPCAARATVAWLLALACMWA